MNGRATVWQMLLLTSIGLFVLCPPGFAADIHFLLNDSIREDLRRTLDEVGDSYGYAVSTHEAQTASASQWSQMTESADRIVVFSPGSRMRTREAELLEWLGEGDKPWLLVRGDTIRSSTGDKELATRQAQYLNQGGRQNFQRFFEFLAKVESGADPWTVAAPIVIPETGLYHPDAPDRVFATLENYLRWTGPLPADAPRIGVAIHDSHVRSEATAWIDSTIQEIEKQGAVPIVFFTPMTWGDGFKGLLLEGRQEAPIDVLLYYRATLNAPGRLADFQALNIPVIQGLYYPDGEELDWRADPAGFPHARTPFYLSTAEMVGVTDPSLIAVEDRKTRSLYAVQPELKRLIERAIAYSRLSELANSEKRIATYIYNYPPGAGNVAASNLNVPESLAVMMTELAHAGFSIDTPDVQEIIESTKALVGSYYDKAALISLLENDLAALLPVADYKQWMQAESQKAWQATIDQWGTAEGAWTVIEKEGKPYFVVPRWQVGNMTILPQPARTMSDKGANSTDFHSTDKAFSHDYWASYVWVHLEKEAHALVHFGTHGTAEFGMGKERALSLNDAPYMVVGATPHFYPYIMDNLAEATLAKRRSRAVIISHQTPPFAPAAIYYELLDVHDLVHDWTSMSEGPARDRVADSIIAAAQDFGLIEDLGGLPANKDMSSMVMRLHDYLHELASQSEPLGLHVFGRSPEPEMVVSTVMQMLGPEFLEAVVPDPEEREELFVGEFSTSVRESLPFKVLSAELLGATGSEPLAMDLPEVWRARARSYFDALTAENEMGALINGLQGAFVMPGPGGDPIANPDALPTGRNLYGFDPSRLPTKQAFAAGQALMQDLIDQHLQTNGAAPKRIAFTLWAMEAMRHYGVVEGQVMAALGVKPVWNARNRLQGIEVIDREELGRPRIDVVLQATGLYRDAFGESLKLLHSAAAAVAKLDDEQDNPVAQMSQYLRSRLVEQGLDLDTAISLSEARLFSSATGLYGSGVPDAVSAVDSWAQDGAVDENAVGRVFLERFNHAYVGGKAGWSGVAGQVELFGEHLAVSEAAVLSRTSNLFGLLSTDDPFAYLGGLSAGIRAAGGGAASLYISNLRRNDSQRMEIASGFLSREVRTRFQNPKWIESMVAEGYAGTTRLQGTMENLWGWQATDRKMVRSDQWDRFHEVYVQDLYELGLTEWFEQQNPEARTRIMERMLDAVRTDFWEIDQARLEQLLTDYLEWVEIHGPGQASEQREQFVAETASGLGLSELLPSPEAAMSVVGQIMQPVAEQQPSPFSIPREWLYVLAMFCLIFSGAIWQARRAT